MNLEDYRADLAMFERDLRRALMVRHRHGGRLGNRWARRDRILGLVRIIRPLRMTCVVASRRGEQMELFGQ